MDLTAWIAWREFSYTGKNFDGDPDQERIKKNPYIKIRKNYIFEKAKKNF